MGFIANFMRFPAVQKCENRLRFDKVADSLKVGTFRDTVYIHVAHCHCCLVVLPIPVSPRTLCFAPCPSYVRAVNKSLRGQWL